MVVTTLFWRSETGSQPEAGIQDGGWAEYFFFVDWCHCVRGYFAPTRLFGYHEYKMGRLLQDTANLGLTLNFASLFADTIMDILGCTQARHAILEYYQSSGEPQAIQQAINVCRRGASKTSTMAWGKLL